MANKSSQSDTVQGTSTRPALERQTRVSESGQFAVSMDAVRTLPSFDRDLKNVAQIRQKLKR